MPGTVLRLGFALAVLVAGCGRVGYEVTSVDAPDGPPAPLPRAPANLDLSADGGAAAALADGAAQPPGPPASTADASAADAALPDAPAHDTILHAASDPVVVYAPGATLNVLTERSLASLEAPGPARALPATRAGAQWLAGAAHGREAVVAMSTVVGRSGQLSVLRLRDDAWSLEWTAEMNDDYAESRAFDVAFEQRSGRAMVAWSGGAESVWYRLLDGDAWTAPRRATLPPGSSFLWVELAARDGSDDLALAARTLSGRRYAARWRADAWGAEQELVEEAPALPSRDFALAFESGSGGLLAVWGPRSRLARLSAEAVTWTAPQAFDVVSGRVTHVDLAPRPGSDQIAVLLCDADGTGRLGAAIWDGSVIAERREIASGTSLAHWSATGSRSQIPAAAAWAGSRLAVVFSRNDGTLGHARFLSGAGWGQAGSLPLPGGVRSTRSHLGAPLGGRAVFVFSELDGGLRHAWMTGDDWYVAATALSPSIANGQLGPFVLLGAGR